MSKDFNKTDFRDVSEEYRPKNNNLTALTGEKVAVIDLDIFRSGTDAERTAAIESIGQACSCWGFFQAINHGVPQSLIDRMKRSQRQFFALPLEEKKKVVRTSTNSRGYFNDELTKQNRDWKEGFDFGAVPNEELPHDHPDNVCQDGLNQWPQQPEGFREVQWEYFHVMEKLSSRLLELIAESLGLDPLTFAPHFGEHHTSLQRLNYYPPCPTPLEVLGVNHHTDAGVLTIVAQDDVPGLQVLSKEGKWVDIEPLEGALVINIGDMMQVWTNNLYVAPVHRVIVHADKERISTPFFYNPAYNSDVAPLPSLLERTGSSSMYKPINFGQFRARRFAGDYADHGEEIQIAQFAVK